MYYVNKAYNRAKKSCEANENTRAHFHFNIFFSFSSLLYCFRYLVGVGAAATAVAALLSVLLLCVHVPPLCVAYSLWKLWIQERSKFGKIGWNANYDFNEFDYDTSVKVLSSFFQSVSCSFESGFQWNDLKLLIGEVSECDVCVPITLIMLLEYHFIPYPLADAIEDVNSADKLNSVQCNTDLNACTFFIVSWVYLVVFVEINRNKSKCLCLINQWALCVRFYSFQLK